MSDETSSQDERVPSQTPYSGPFFGRPASDVPESSDPAPAWTPLGSAIPTASSFARDAGDSDSDSADRSDSSSGSSGSGSTSVGSADRFGSSSGFSGTNGSSSFGSSGSWGGSGSLGTFGSSGSTGTTGSFGTGSSGSSGTGSFGSFGTSGAPDDADQSADNPITDSFSMAPQSFPDDIVDLTDAPPPAPEPVVDDSAFVPAGTGAGEQSGIDEPVPDTVVVDPEVLGGHTVVSPTEVIAPAARSRGDQEMLQPGPDLVVGPRRFEPPSVYGGWPSLTLLVFRLIIAAILIIRATQQLLHFTATKTEWAISIMPSPVLFTWGQIIVGYVIALMLIVGFGARIAGILLLVVNVVVLSFITWGAVNPFASGVVGFRGEVEVLFVVCGLLLAGIGGGSFLSVDAAIHKARLETKNAKATSAAV